MLFGSVHLVDINDIASTPTTRLAVHWPGRSPRELAARLAGLAARGVHCWIYPGESYADLTATGVSKAAALERLRCRLGVAPAATLAVGDGTNDIAMLAWAGHGIAMGQASAHVRAAADEVCPPVTADGLATALSQWFR